MSADRLRHYDVGWTPHVFHLHIYTHGLAISLALSLAPSLAISLALTLALSLALTLGLSLVHSADPVSGQCTQPSRPWTHKPSSNP
jgi:hypothetical protein